MENLENISVVVYFVFVVLAMFFGKMTWANRKVESKLLRLIVGVLLFPALGCIFWVLGKIGNFMLIPFSHLF